MLRAASATLPVLAGIATQPFDELSIRVRNRVAEGKHSLAILPSGECLFGEVARGRQRTIAVGARGLSPLRDHLE